MSHDLLKAGLPIVHASFSEGDVRKMADRIFTNGFGIQGKPTGGSKQPANGLCHGAGITGSHG